MKFITFLFFLFLIVSCGSSQNKKTFFDEGFKQYELKNYSAGVKTFTKGIKITKESDPQYFVGRAICNFELSAYDQVKRDIKKVFSFEHTDESMDWSYGTAHRLLSSIYEVQMDTINQLKELKKAEKYLKNNHKLLCNIGLTEIDLGKLESGINYISKSIEISPTDFAYNNRALGYIKLKNFEKAWKDLEQSKKLNSENPYLFQNYGLYYIAIGELTSACNSFNHALDPKYDSIWYLNDKENVEELLKTNCN